MAWIQKWAEVGSEAIAYLVIQPPAREEGVQVFLCYLHSTALEGGSRWGTEEPFLGALKLLKFFLHQRLPEKKYLIVFGYVAFTQT